MSACIPFVPDCAAAVLTLRSLPSVVADDHAEKEPDSKPSAKMRSPLDELTVTVGARPSPEAGCRPPSAG